jgi:hypothetical protein
MKGVHRVLLATGSLVEDAVLGSLYVVSPLLVLVRQERIAVRRDLRLRYGDDASLIVMRRSAPRDIRPKRHPRTEADTRRRAPWLSNLPPRSS